MPKFSLDEVATHLTHDDIWVVIHEKVYNLTAFLQKHPGGKSVLSNSAGKDATLKYETFFHSEQAHEILEELYVGELLH
jgi:cytochrome b involved in lipid metabolism